ncbi:hypothetical protein [Mycobacterium sp. URHB0021]
MSLAVYLYVDNSKLWAEGKRLSAVKAGPAFSGAGRWNAIRCGRRPRSGASICR